MLSAVSDMYFLAKDPCNVTFDVASKTKIIIIYSMQSPKLIVYQTTKIYNVFF